MPARPFPITGFRGLRLDVEADEAGAEQAIDMLNVELDRPGAVRSRDGYAKLTSSAGATRYDQVAPVATGTTSLSSLKSPGTGANDASAGTGAWIKIGATFAADIGTADGSQSQMTTTTSQSQYLKATNFGYAVPGTATIQGILVEIRKVTTSVSTVDARVRLVNSAGTILTTDKADTVTPWPLALGVYTAYGGASDLWGAAWTPTDINDVDFGAVIAANNPSGGLCQVDHMRITVYYTLANTALVLASAAAGRIDAINSDGTVATTVATASDQQAFYANFGSPSAIATYIAVGTGALMRKYSGAAFSTVAGSPKGRYVALQSPDNRLVSANISTIPTSAGSTASTSLVHFSDAGSPEVWSANNYVYVSPGDGEDIQGIVAWRELLFVFKSTKFFVFYGNSTDASGNPVFNYRPITAGIGLASPLGIAVGPNGVYFLDRRGIYLTTGQTPTRISNHVDPLFLGGATSFYKGGTINPTVLSQASLCWFSGRLYMGFPSGSATTNDKTLVLDPEDGNWLLWDVPMGAMAAVGSQPANLVFTYSQGTNDLGQYAQNAYTTDAGTAVSWRYRSGFYTVGNAPDQEVNVRETIIDGVGSPTFSLARDWGSVPASGGGAQATVTLGTSPATAQGRHRSSQRGRRFSYQLEGSAAARVDSLTHQVRGLRGGSEKTT